MARCDSYFRHGIEYRCYATEHPAECLCGGDEKKCDFFPERREPKKANEKLLIDKERLREVLLRYLNAPHMRFRDRALMRIAVRACISYLDSQRPVDAVEVVHGRWIHTAIEDDNWGGTFHSWTCSNCDFSTSHNPNGTNYCPHCGAKMDGEKMDGERKDNGRR